MRRAILTAAGILAIAALAYSQEQAETARQLEGLLRTRLEAAEKEYGAVSQIVLLGRGRADELIESSERLLNARLSLADSQNEKLAAYDDAIRIGKRLQVQLAPLIPTSIPIQQAARLEYWLADLEIRRLQLASDAN